MRSLVGIHEPSHLLRSHVPHEDLVLFLFLCSKAYEFGERFKLMCRSFMLRVPQNSSASQIVSLNSHFKLSSILESPYLFSSHAYPTEEIAACRE